MSDKVRGEPKVKSFEHRRFARSVSPQYAQGESAGARRRERERDASGRGPNPLSSDPHEFAKPGMADFGCEIPFEQRKDRTGARQPRFVSGAFVFGHHGKRIDFLRQAAAEGNARDKMDEVKKWGKPGLDDNKAAIRLQDTGYFAKGLVEILRELWKMMEATLNDGDIPAFCIEGECAAVADITLCGAFEPFKKGGGKVSAFDIMKAETFKGVEPVAAAAEELDDLCVTRPLIGAELLKTPRELGDFLLGSFKTRVGFLPFV